METIKLTSSEEDNIQPNSETEEKLGESALKEYLQSEEFLADQMSFWAKQYRDHETSFIESRKRKTLS